MFPGVAIIIFLGVCIIGGKIKRKAKTWELVPGEFRRTQACRQCLRHSGHGGVAPESMLSYGEASLLKSLKTDSVSVHVTKWAALCNIAFQHDDQSTRSMYPFRTSVSSPTTPLISPFPPPTRSLKINHILTPTSLPLHLSPPPPQT